jgi:anti-sigma regulatory factor (Ser/Thr protein kinase)
MPAELRRSIAALAAPLSELQLELAAFLEDARLSPKSAHDVELVCDELLGNAVRHGARGRSGAEHRIEITIALGERAVIRIRDDLPLFDPTVLPAPPRPAGIASAPIGGRGIALVRRVAKVFRWHADRGWNVVDVEIEIERGREEPPAAPRSHRAP